MRNWIPELHKWDGSMPYDEKLDSRIAEIVSGWYAERRKMFGGTCYLIRGNMLCGVYREYLILRLGDKLGAEALKKPHVKPFDITGRPMKGWVMVEENGFKSGQLAKWIEKARQFVETLPPK
jgi:hypothetical protein